MEGEGVRTVQGRQGIVTFRPYRDIKTKPIKKCYVVDQNHRGEEQSVFGGQRTVAEDLYPEILCHVFSMLDTESKGRTAQVRIGPSAPVPVLYPPLTPFLCRCASAGETSATPRTSGVAARHGSTSAASTR